MAKRTNAQKSRAKRYRARHREGVDPLNPQELAWFERYESGLDLEMDTPGKESGSDPNQDVPDESDDAGGSPADTDPSASPNPDVTVADPPAPDVIPPPPPAPPPPPPPRAAPRAPKAAPLPPPPRSIKAESDGTGSWQSKYWPDTVGRENTCKVMADYTFSILHHMQSQCKDVGVEPIIDLEKVAGTFVIAFDKILPPEFTITPETVAAAATATTVTQRWMHRKKIAEAQKSFAEKKDAESRKSDAERDRVKAEADAAARRYMEQKAAAEAAAKAGPAPTRSSAPPPPPPPPPPSNHNSSPVGEADEDRLA